MPAPGNALELPPAKLRRLHQDFLGAPIGGPPNPARSEVRPFPQSLPWNEPPRPAPPPAPPGIRRPRESIEERLARFAPPSKTYPKLTPESLGFFPSPASDLPEPEVTDAEGTTDVDPMIESTVVTTSSGRDLPLVSEFRGPPAEPGTRDLWNDGAYRDLRQDPSSRDLHRDLGVLDSRGPEEPLRGGLPTEVLFVASAARSGGFLHEGPRSLVTTMPATDDLPLAAAPVPARSSEIGARPRAVSNAKRARKGARARRARSAKAKRASAPSRARRHSGTHR
jgi:hypothetical protein